jgi:hypothetical protein
MVKQERIEEEDCSSLGAFTLFSESLSTLPADRKRLLTHVRSTLREVDELEPQRTGIFDTLVRQWIRRHSSEAQGKYMKQKDKARDKFRHF